MLLFLLLLLLLVLLLLLLLLFNLFFNERALALILEINFEDLEDVQVELLKSLGDLWTKSYLPVVFSEQGPLFLFSSDDELDADDEDFTLSFD